ncbi:MAG: VTT domain-containing protein [Candidatus Bathyarchaeota archaeon]|jgi:membrane protein DedA with SNARE-associated domain|nr:MAG: VTT domain-containing protein [Candidatus Bathyarchaeota archaeon]
MRSLALQFGYLGVFLISLLGTMAIIIPIPYTLVILFLGIDGWDPLMLTLAGGVGSALGEFIGYFLGYYGRKVISQERLKNMDYLLKLFGKYTPAAIFLFALTPLPDDLLFIPLGILRYNPIKALLPALAGKSLMSYILASFGNAYGDFLVLLFGDEKGLIGAVMTGVLLILVIYVLYRVDWQKVFEKYVGSRDSHDDAA